MTITATQRLQNDIENICKMAKDDIDSARWLLSGRAPRQSADQLRSAIDNLKIALDLIAQ